MSRGNLAVQLLPWRAARGRKLQPQPDLAPSNSSRIPEQSRDPMNLRCKPAHTTALRWRPKSLSIAPASEKLPPRLCCPATRKTIRPPAGSFARWDRAQPTSSIRSGTPPASLAWSSLLGHFRTSGLQVFDSNFRVSALIVLFGLRQDLS